MKMENTLANKAKFFAQYWGQELIKDKDCDVVYPVDRSNILLEIHQSYLELKPLSSISDEDAVEVAKIVCYEMFANAENDPIQIERQDEWLTVWRKRNINSVDIDFLGYTTCQNEDLEYKRNHVGTTCAVDFLRSKGYALPWMGISVEQQVEWGWVKLKGETK